MKKIISIVLAIAMIACLGTTYLHADPNEEWGDIVDNPWGNTVSLGKWEFTQGGLYESLGNAGYINKVTMTDTGEELTGWERGNYYSQSQSSSRSSTGFTLNIDTNGWIANWDENPYRINPTSIESEVISAMNKNKRYIVSFKAKASKTKYGYVYFCTTINGHEQSPYGQNSLIEGSDNRIIKLYTTEKQYTYIFDNTVGGTTLNTRILWGCFIANKDGKVYDFDGKDVSNIVTEEEKEWRGTVNVREFTIQEINPSDPVPHVTTSSPQNPTTQYVPPYDLNKSTGVLRINKQELLEDSETGIMPWEADKNYIRKVIISPGITYIGQKCFYNLPNLETVEMPNGLISIRSKAFYNCTSLEAAPLPNTIRSIGDSAFENCSILCNVNLPSSLTTIGEKAFYNCWGIKKIVVPSGVRSLGKYAFGMCTGLESATLNNKPDTIVEGLFKGCENLKNFDIPKTVNKIDDHAFEGCASFTKLIIPSGVTGIGSAAYMNCLRIHSVVIPLSVIWIGGNTFYGCDGLVTASYLGNKNDWTFVNVGSGNSALLSSLTFHVCAYTKTKVIKPTYTSKGYTIHICEVCGKKYIDSYVKTLQKKVTIKQVVAKKKSIKIAWGRVKGVNGYKIQYSLKKKFKKAKTIKIKKASATSKVLKKLKRKKTYYIRIKSYVISNGKMYESPWSKVKKKRVL